ncbi:hypothetical protein LIP73_12790 [Dorea longicatena]|uniref:hypothetical protein n=1 Tax=Bacillota TaxID=1239 RepID=UPI001D019EFF|nr:MULTISPECIES: hypothetical protein [Lachnospiraceae]MCB5537167.1 hypothetical protein [bacterium MSK17_88]MCB6849852.1 hypothetical protein [bacterium TM473]MCB7079259.1 hypothetical protein [bacterium 210928-DFI.3.100]MCB5369372.1 hypothetical protein [Mediterraneibacter faecis]MCB5547678.1 hypothetical protein [Dorea longicatena]
MAEMKNICGKIPMDLHEKVREEIELTESSTQKFLQQVIEEHFNRLEGKGEISMGAVRTVAVQVSEELFQRLKVVIGQKHMKQKDFLIQIIEEALEKAEAEWQSKEQPEESEQTTEESGTEETQPEESTEPEGECEPEEESEPEGESEPKEENEPEGESEPKEENEPEGESEPEEETEPERETDLEEETKAEEQTEW